MRAGRGPSQDVTAIPRMPLITEKPWLKSNVVGFLSRDCSDHRHRREFNLHGTLRMGVIPWCSCHSPTSKKLTRWPAMRALPPATRGVLVIRSFVDLAMIFRMPCCVVGGSA